MSERSAWLVKSEPESFGFSHLWASPKRTTAWEGVRNYQARNYMRDDMKVGDPVLFYHSVASPPGVAGLAEVASEPYVDATQFDPESSYYDPKATQEAPRWQLVDLRAVRALPRLVTLEELRNDPVLAELDLPLLRRGSRLSVMPVAFEAIARIEAMAASPAPGA